jgi:glycosyltransferase involved in cell wall biosynthesis
MRIGMITGEYPPMQGGIGAFTRILAGEMAAQGHELFVLSRKGAQSDDPRVHLQPSVQQWGLGSLRDARRWAQVTRLDIMNIQYQTAAYSMSPYIHFLPEAIHPIPVVTTFHDLRFPYLFPKAGALRNWIVKRLANASDDVITTNIEDARELHRVCAIIPIGSNIPKIEHTDLQTWRSKAGAKPGDFLIVFFGLINRSKGLDTLLDSIACLKGIPIRLVIVGGGAGSSDPTNAATIREIDAQIERLGLAPIIYKTGYIDEEAVGAYLAAADVVALPFEDGASYRRGSLMAALQQGCAIVTTTPRVPTPAFIDGENMLLVPPRDEALLTTALHHLYQSPDARTHLRQGAATIAQTFAWSGIAQATLNFYTSVIGVKA